MSATVWLNGVFLGAGEARVSAFDAGLQHGVGLFETMLAGRGGVFRLFDHLTRMQVSARALGLSESLRVNPLAEAVRRTVERAGLERARVRLTVTPGSLNMLASARGAGVDAPDPTVMIVAQPATQYPEAMFEQGVLATIADGRLNPLDDSEGHKTVNYWRRLRALRDAGAKGAGEAVFLQISNHLAGGAVSNLFIVRDGALLTPIARGEEADVAGVGGDPDSAASGARVVRSPVLPGVTRAVVMAIAERERMRVERRMLSIADLLDADEAFLTNSGWGVLPVTRVEGKAIGGGAVGPATRLLREGWLRQVQTECSGG